MTRRNAPETLRGVLALIDARSLPSEDLLARYLADRDAVAFRVLVERYSGLVARRCREVLRRDDLAEDAFQETFLRLVTHGHAVRRAERVGAWLAVTARRVAANLRTRADRRRRHEMAAGVDPDRSPPADPAAATAVSEIGVVVAAELARLPERYRLPLECVYLDGMTHAEAAQALGVPKGTVDSAVARGLERLRSAAGRLGLAGTLAAVGGLEAVLALSAQAAPPAWVAAVTQAAAAAVPRQAGLLAVVHAALATRFVVKSVAVGLIGVVTCAGVGLALVRTADRTHAAPEPGPPVRATDGRPAESLPDRNRRVLEADTLPRVVDALRPLALNGGEIRATQVVVHDFRAWFEVELRHKDAPAKVAATRLRFYFDTRTRFCRVQVDEWNTGRFHLVAPDRPIVLLRVPESKLEVALRSMPLDHAIGVLREFAPDPRVAEEAEQHCRAVSRALTPLTGLWLFRGDPHLKRSRLAVPHRLRPDDEIYVPGPETTHHLKARDIEVGPDGRFRIWWDEGWYQLTDGGRLELTGSDQWWVRDPNGKLP